MEKSVIVPEHAVQAQLEEVEAGIVERRPKVIEYHQRLLQAGLRDVHIDVYETYNVPAAQQRAWVLRLRQLAVQHVRLRFKPMVWLGLTLISLLPAARAARLTLYLNGGNLFIRAVKPPN